MTNSQIETEQPPHSQTPLLTSNQKQGEENIDDKNNKNEDIDGNGNGNGNGESEEEERGGVEKSLARLERFLTVLGFNQDSILSLVLSWSMFAAVGVAVPLVALSMSDCSECEKYEIQSFEMVIVAFQASLAAASLLCLSYNLRKYGLRKFLFVDRYSGQMQCFHRDYVAQISVSTLVQVVGVIICLHAATRISHRAQGIVSVASRWHAMVACTSSDTPQFRSFASSGSLEAANHSNPIQVFRNPRYHYCLG